MGLVVVGFSVVAGLVVGVVAGSVLTLVDLGFSVVTGLVVEATG